MKHNPHLRHLGCLLVAMIALASWLVVGAMDPEGYEIARYRNALIAERGVAGDFDWTPATRPGNFLQERGAVPADISRWPALSATGTTVERALAIAKSLSSKPRLGGQIGQSVSATLRDIDATGNGYCVDYATVFAALAYASGIDSRVWAISFDGFGGHGHVFNEIWDSESRVWAMIDVFNGFYPRDTSTGKLISTLEFRQRLTLAPESLRWERIAPEMFGFKNDAVARDYFQRGFQQMSLWWGNNFISYDLDPQVAQARRLGRLAERVAALASGALPKLRMLVTEQNRGAFEDLMWIKTKIFAVAILEFILGLLLLRELWQLRSKRTNFPRRNVMTQSTTAMSSLAALVAALWFAPLAYGQIRTMAYPADGVAVLRVQGASRSGLDYFASKTDPAVGEGSVRQLLSNVEVHHLNKELLQNITNGRYDTALADIDFVLRYFPNHPGGLQMLTTVAALSKKSALAVKYFEHALALYPNYAITHAQYGRLFLVLGDVNLAIKKLEKAIEMDPKLAASYVILAQAHDKRGDAKAAREARERAKELGFTGNLGSEGNK